MTNFPTSTTNKNVLRNTLLLCEFSQCSGEIITTTFAMWDGVIWQVTDWVGNKPHKVNLDDVAREMNLAPVAIMRAIVNFYEAQA